MRPDQELADRLNSQLLAGAGAYGLHALILNRTAYLSASLQTLAHTLDESSGPNGPDGGAATHPSGAVEQRPTVLTRTSRIWNITVLDAVESLGSVEPSRLVPWLRSRLGQPANDAGRAV